MSVIEVGSHSVRCGNIGDSAPTQVLMPSHYTFTDRCPHPPRYAASELLTDPAVDAASVIPLWTNDALQQHMSLHMDQLSYAARTVLCQQRESLMIVLHDIWHERLDRMQTIVSQLLEGDVCKHLYLARSSVCWALSQNKPTAVVLDCGHAKTMVAAVADGCALRRSVSSCNLGGLHVSAALSSHIEMPYAHTLSGRVHPDAPDIIQRIARQHAVNELKELWSCVTLHGAKSTTSSSSPSEPAGEKFVAPDGTPLKIAATSTLSPTQLRESMYECLFRDEPASMANSAAPSAAHIPKLLLRCRRGLDVDLQGLTVPILLCGGTSHATYFGERVLNELRREDSSFFKVRTLQTCPVDGAFVGASMAAESSAFQPLWITKKDFDEEGPSVVQRKLCY